MIQAMSSLDYREDQPISRKLINNQSAQAADLTTRYSISSQKDDEKSHAVNDSIKPVLPEPAKPGQMRHQDQYQFIDMIFLKG